MNKPYCHKQIHSNWNFARLNFIYTSILNLKCCNHILIRYRYFVERQQQISEEYRELSHARFFFSKQAANLCGKTHAMFKRCTAIFRSRYLVRTFELNQINWIQYVLLKVAKIDIKFKILAKYGKKKTREKRQQKINEWESLINRPRSGRVCRCVRLQLVLYVMCVQAHVSVFFQLCKYPFELVCLYLLPFLDRNHYIEFFF